MTRLLRRVRELKHPLANEITDPIAFTVILVPRGALLLVRTKNQAS